MTAGRALHASGRGDSWSHNENAGWDQDQCERGLHPSKDSHWGKEASVITGNMCLFSAPDGAFPCYCSFDLQYCLHANEHIKTELAVLMIKPCVRWDKLMCLHLSLWYMLSVRIKKRCCVLMEDRGHGSTCPDVLVRGRVCVTLTRAMCGSLRME